jgi:hypothetical protein
MNAEKLARMANQIVANLQFGTEAEVVHATADHLMRFWNRPMRHELAQGHAEGTVELSEIAARALAVALQPDAKPDKDDTGGDAG